VSELIIILSISCIVYLMIKGGKKNKGVNRQRRRMDQESTLFQKDISKPHSYESKPAFGSSELLVDVPIPSASNTNTTTQVVVPHKKSTYLATKTERKFYNVLQDILSDDYVIHTQVSLMALVQPLNFKDNSKTWAKRMDYVITDKETKVYAVIELDDSSHRQKKRQERDHYVNSVLEGHHPLLRFEARSHYDKGHLTKVIERDTDIKCKEYKSALQHC